jgi:hypothetical protein
VSRLLNRWMVILGAVTISISMLAGKVSAQQANIEAGKKEGKVVVYGSVVPQAMEGLHQAFKKKYGIDVEYWRGSSTQVSERGVRCRRRESGCAIDHEERGPIPEVYSTRRGKVPRAIQGKGWAHYAMARFADQYSLQHRPGEAE